MSGWVDGVSKKMAMMMMMAMMRCGAQECCFQVEAFGK
jgi:hypothetical protein